MVARRVAEGAVVLAVCAGFQVVGHSFPGAEGEPHEGLGLLPVTTAKVALPRAVGEVTAEPDEALGLPVLTGFENHGGRSTLDEGAQPLARVQAGVGNGDGVEGALAGAGGRHLPARARAGPQSRPGRPSPLVGARRRRAGAARRRRGREPARRTAGGGARPALPAAAGGLRRVPRCAGSAAYRTCVTRRVVRSV